MAEYPIVQAYAVDEKGIPSAHYAVDEKGIPSAPYESYPRDYAKMKEMLLSLNFTNKMVQFFIEDSKKVEYYGIIADDSGSMATHDGEKIVKGEGIGTTRFEEMCIPIFEEYSLFRNCNIPSSFITLNNGTINIDNNSCQENELKSLLTSPNGGTPLGEKLNEFLNNIRLIEGQKKLIIYTDGVPNESNQTIIRLLNRLLELKTSITIRLCTDDRSIINYWNNIDNNLEIDIDIVDSYFSEKKEVNNKNPQINYTYHVHKLREYGVVNGMFDKMDEIKLEQNSINFINALAEGSNYYVYRKRSTCNIC